MVLLRKGSWLVTEGGRKEQKCFKEGVGLFGERYGGQLKG